MGWQTPDVFVTTNPERHTLQMNIKDRGHVFETKVMPLCSTVSRVTTNEAAAAGNWATISTALMASQRLATAPLNRITVHDLPAKNGLPVIVIAPPVEGSSKGVTLMMTGAWASRSDKA